MRSRRNLFLRAGKTLLVFILILAMGVVPLPVNASTMEETYGKANAYFFVNGNVTNTLEMALDGSVTFDISAYPEGPLGENKYGKETIVQITMYRMDGGEGGGALTYDLLRNTPNYGATWDASDPGSLQNVRIPDIQPGIYGVYIYTSWNNYRYHENAVTVVKSGNKPEDPSEGCVVRFFLNGGVGLDGEDYDRKEVKAGTTLILPAAPIQNGSGFLGWQDGSTLYPAGASYKVTGDVSFTAMWEKKGNITVTLPNLRLIGSIWLSGTWKDVAGAEQSAVLWSKSYDEVTSPESIVLEQWQLSGRSYERLELCAMVDGVQTVVASYDGSKSPVTEDTNSVALETAGGPYLPVTGLDVTGLTQGTDYRVERITGQAEGDGELYLPCLTKQGNRYQVRLGGKWSSPFYDRYDWNEKYPAELSGSRLVVTPFDLTETVEVRVNLTYVDGETASYRDVTATQRICGAERTVRGYTGEDGKAVLSLFPGTDAVLDIPGCYVKNGAVLPGDAITAGKEHAMTVGLTLLTARIHLSTETDAAILDRYLTSLYSPLELQIRESGGKMDTASLFLKGKEASDIIQLNNTAAASSLQISLRGKAILETKEVASVTEGCGTVDFTAALRPGALIPLAAETTGGYRLAWYDESGALRGMTENYVLSADERDVPVPAPADETGSSVTGSFTLVLIPSSYAPVLQGKALSELTEDMKAALWDSVELKEDIITELAAKRVDQTTGKNARYVTQPASELTTGRESFSGLKDLVTFTGHIGLDDVCRDGKLSSLTISTEKDWKSTARVQSLVLGGRICSPAYSQSGVYRYSFEEGVSLPCDFTLYCEPESIETDMQLSAAAEVSFAVEGEKKSASGELIGEASVARPGGSIRTLSAYVCSDRVKLTGTALPNEEVTILDGEVRVGSAMGDRNGEWMALVPLNEADLSETKISTTHELSAVTSSGVRSETLRIFHQADGPELKSLSMEWGDEGNRTRINAGDVYYFNSGELKNLTFTAAFENPDKLLLQPGFDAKVVFKVYLSSGEILLLEGTAGAAGTFTARADNQGSAVRNVQVLYLPDLRSGEEAQADGSRTITALSQDADALANLQTLVRTAAVPESGSYAMDFTGNKPSLTAELPEGFTLPFDEEILSEVRQNLTNVGVTPLSYSARFGEDTVGADDLLAWIAAKADKEGRDKVQYFERTVQFTDPAVFAEQKKLLSGIADEHTTVRYPAGSAFSADRYSLSDVSIDDEGSIRILTWCIAADFVSAKDFYAANVTVYLGKDFAGFAGRSFDAAALQKKSSDTDVLESSLLANDYYGGKFTQSNSYDVESNVETFTGITSTPLGVAGPYLDAAGVRGAGAWGHLGAGLTTINTICTIENSYTRWETTRKMYSDIRGLMMSPCYRKIMNSSLGDLAENAQDNFVKDWKKYSGSDGVVTVTSVGGNILSTVLGAIPIPVTQVASAGVAGATGIFSFVSGQYVSNDYENLVKSYEKQYDTIRRLFRRYAQKTGDKDCLEGLDGDGGEMQVSYDPSGIVYEGVIENPVGGATVTLYMASDAKDQKVLEGEEGKVSKLISPVDTRGIIPADTVQTTGEDGRFEWAVPEGLWFVTAGKGGLYGNSNKDRAATSGVSGLVLDTHSVTNLLPVLPPQVDVNIPLVDASAPLVQDAELSEDGIRITFSKYMKEGEGADSALNTANYSLFSDESLEIKSVTALEEGHAPSNIDPLETRYVKKVLLQTASPLQEGLPVTLRVSGRTASYAGTAMGVDYVSGGLVGSGGSEPDPGPEEGFLLKGLESSYVYTGFPITPDITVYSGNTLLREGREFKISLKKNMNQGTATLTLKGMGDYNEKSEKTFTILPADLSKDNSSVTAFREEKGSKTTITVYYNGQKLKEKRDYTVEGTTIKGTGNFKGERAVTEEAKALVPIGKTDISLPKSVTYTGETITPEISVKSKTDGSTLTEGMHYKVLYTAGKNTGTATMYIIGLEGGGYTGAAKKTFKITPVSLKDSERITVQMKTEASFTKVGGKPEITITFENEGHKRITLREGVDYSVKYKNNAKGNLAGTKDGASCVIKGIGHFKDTLPKKAFTVTKTPLSELKFGTEGKQYKAGKTTAYYATAPVIFDAEGKQLSSGKDFRIKEYQDSAGKVIQKTDAVSSGTDSITLILEGIGGFEGELPVKCRVSEEALTKISMASVTRIPVQPYTGDAVTPDIMLSIKGKGTLTENRNYKILGYYNNVRKGTAMILVQGIGDYTGTKTITFKIGPAVLQIP